MLWSCFQRYFPIRNLSACKYQFISTSTIWTPIDPPMDSLFSLGINKWLTMSYPIFSVCGGFFFCIKGFKVVTRNLMMCERIRRCIKERSKFSECNGMMEQFDTSSGYVPVLCSKSHFLSLSFIFIYIMQPTKRLNIVSHCLA